MRLLAAIAVAATILAAPVGLAATVHFHRARVPTTAEQEHAVGVWLGRGEAVYCGGPHGNAVALTFDDGPGPYTARLLAELRAAGAHATFFLVGNRLQYWPHLARPESRLGAVGNHTWSHPRLVGLPRWLVWLELARTQWQEQQELGRKPELFRVPYELHDATVDSVARSLGLLQVFWSVDSGDDVRNAKPARIVRNVLAGLRPGAIVIMHDIHPWTVRALPRILRAIHRRGLRAVSVPELLALDPPSSGRACPIPPPANA